MRWIFVKKHFINDLSTFITADLVWWFESKNLKSLYLWITNISNSGSFIYVIRK